MSTLSSSLPTRVACYARVSTEDQAERQTVQAQTDFLRRYCDLHGLPVAGVYVDDGISGATPLEDRPEGRRLLRDAADGAFTVVLVYRLDRLGRSLKSLLDAHEQLDRAGVAIRSGTDRSTRPARSGASCSRCWVAWRSSSAPRSASG